VIRRVVSRQRRGLLRRLYTVVCYACPGRWSQLAYTSGSVTPSCQRCEATGPS